MATQTVAYGGVITVPFYAMGRTLPDRVAGDTRTLDGGAVTGDNTTWTFPGAVDANGIMSPQTYYNFRLNKITRWVLSSGSHSYQNNAPGAVIYQDTLFTLNQIASVNSVQPRLIYLQQSLPLAGGNTGALTATSRRPYQLGAGYFGVDDLWLSTVTPGQRCYLIISNGGTCSFEFFLPGTQSAVYALPVNAPYQTFCGILPDQGGYSWALVNQTGSGYGLWLMTFQPNLTDGSTRVSGPTALQFANAAQFGFTGQPGVPGPYPAISQSTVKGTNRDGWLFSTGVAYEPGNAYRDYFFINRTCTTYWNLQFQLPASAPYNVSWYGNYSDPIMDEFGVFYTQDPNLAVYSSLAPAPYRQFTAGIPPVQTLPLPPFRMPSYGCCQPIAMQLPAING